MSDPLFDDVKELLDKEKGDEKILRQIFRAFENNEVISNYERNYVQKLAEKYLGRKPLVEDKQSIKKSNIPDVIISEPTSIPKSQIFQKETPKISKSKSKDTKMILGFGGAALTIIIIIAVMSSGITDVVPNTTVTKSITTSATSFSIETDSNSYQKKDIISISGKSITSDFVDLSIEKQDGTIVWAEQVKTKSDGRFSTLVIAAGPGWEKSGTFILKAQSNSETQSRTFSFTS